MRVYAISDLHLSGFKPKPMNIFGDNWNDHWMKIRANWHENVKDDDLVLIPGDISWAMKLVEAQVDLNQICDLPGTKVLLKGNHDYWWSSVTRLRSVLYNKTFVIQNDALEFEKYSISGTRGWLCPNEREFQPADEKIYLREIERLKLSLEKIKPCEDKKIIVMMHYPPFNENREDTGFTELFKKHGVDTVIYGHLHDASAFKSFNGLHNDIAYLNVSCDYLGFKLMEICVDKDKVG